MNVSQKPKVYSSWDIIITSIRLFAITHPSKMFYVLVITLISLAKNVFHGVDVLVQDKLKTSNSVFYNMLILMLMLRLCFFGLSFCSELIFERHLAKYGGAVATMVMRSVFFSEELNAFEISGGMIEYYITEGAKAMAKISRFMVLNLFAKVSLIPIDLMFIYYKDESNRKIVFLVCLVGTIIITVIKMAQVKRTLEYMKAAVDASYEREKVYTEAVDNLPVVKAYRCEKAILERYDDKLKTWAGFQTTFKFQCFINDLTYGALGSTFRIIAAMIFVKLHENCQAKSIAILLSITKGLLDTGTGIIKLHQDILESLSVSHIVLEYLRLLREDPGSKFRVNMFSDKIELKNITYLSRGKVVFSNVDMVLKKGDKAALYGRNGVGKSSIFKVLLNFDEYGGELYFDGINIKNICIRDYRKLITFVPQDTRLFDESIYNNLRIGNEKSFAEVVEECKKLNLHDKIMALPNGYNTIVGEGGKNINGGLRQKIFYGRAFLRDTPIYLFDEPTNNLDKANSEFLIEYINDPKYANKTFLVICHDMEIVNRFPKIYKFDENKIILEKE